MKQGNKKMEQSDRSMFQAKDNLIVKTLDVLGTPVLALAALAFVLYIACADTTPAKNAVAIGIVSAFLVSHWLRLAKLHKVGLILLLISLWLGFNITIFFFAPYISLSSIALVIVLFSFSLLLERSWYVWMSILTIVLHFGYYFLLRAQVPFLAGRPQIEIIYIILYSIFLSISTVIGALFQRTLMKTVIEAEKKHALFRTVVNQFESAVIILNSDLIIEEMNRSAAKLLDVSYTKAIGQSIYAVLPGYLYDQAKEIAQATLQNTRLSKVQLETKTKKGEPLYLRVSARLLQPDSKANAYFMVSVIDDTSQKLTEHQIQRLAFIDHLTKVENRLSFNYKINSLINTMNQGKGQFSLIYFDLDRFKSVNDEHGHAAGDKILAEFAKRLVNVTRGEDFIARIGGDEFVLLMENLPSKTHLENALSRLRVALNMPYQIEGSPLYLTVSFGVSHFPEDGDSPDTLLKKADAAMYREKFDSSPQSNSL